MQIDNQYERSFGRHSPQMINKSQTIKNDRQARSQNIQGPQEQQPEQQMGLLQQFKQQMMKAWQPVPTLTKTIIMFFILSAIFLGIGVAMIILSKNLSQSILRYDTGVTCSGNLCTSTLQVTDYLQAPVFVYYQIHNFYQNHRLYASSYSYDQLIGKTITASTAQTDCTPIVYNRNLNTNLSITNQLLKPDDVAIPCGLIAYTIFNDSFTLISPSNQVISISDKGIAWPTDIANYKNSDPNGMWIDVTNQRFMNWMRIAAMSDFRKLWGRIQQDISPGNYKLNITNNYDLSKIKGQKYFVLSTANFFGSKSNFLSITYISVGSVCCLMGFLFLMRKLSKKNKLL